MKKTCKECWYGGRNGMCSGLKIACKKLGAMVNVKTDRRGCKHYTIYPPTGKRMVSYSSLIGDFFG